jgi:hypothetical protein
VLLQRSEHDWRGELSRGLVNKLDGLSFQRVLVKLSIPMLSLKLIVVVVIADW